MKTKTLTRVAGAALFAVGFGSIYVMVMPSPLSKWKHEKFSVLEKKQDELRTWKKQELLSIDHELNECLKVRSEPVCVQKAKTARDVLEITVKEKDDKLTLISVIAESPKLQENEFKLGVWLVCAVILTSIGAFFGLFPFKSKNEAKKGEMQQVRSGETS